MQISIGNQIFNSEEEPIMLVLSDFEKKQISELPEEKNRVVFYLKNNNQKITNKFLDKFMFERTEY